MKCSDCGKVISRYDRHPNCSRPMGPMPVDYCPMCGAGIMDLTRVGKACEECFMKPDGSHAYPFFDE